MKLWSKMVLIPAPCVLYVVKPYNEVTRLQDSTHEKTRPIHTCPLWYVALSATLVSEHKVRIPCTSYVVSTWLYTPMTRDECLGPPELQQQR